MEIKIGTYTLVNLQAPAGVRDFRINGRRLVQPARFLRGDQTRYYARGNRATEVRFDVIRSHASTREAEVFALMHDTQLPEQGLASFSAEASNGALTRRYLIDAVVEITETEVTGLTTRHSYIIRGGSMSTTPTTT